VVTGVRCVFGKKPHLCLLKNPSEQINFFVVRAPEVVARELKEIISISEIGSAVLDNF